MIIWWDGDIYNIIESSSITYNNELKLYNNQLARNKLTSSNLLSSPMITYHYQEYQKIRTGINERIISTTVT